VRCGARTEGDVREGRERRGYGREKQELSELRRQLEAGAQILTQGSRK